MKNKKKYIIITIIILIVLLYILIVFKLASRNNIKTLTNENTYFTLQETINSFIHENNEDNLLELLDDDYIKDNNINQNNVLKLVEYADPSFIARKIISNKKDGISYYFINGYILDINFNSIEYEKNKNYLIISKKDKYVIKPFVEENIEEYAKNYSYDVKELNKGGTFEIITTSEKNKLISYLGEFKNLLYIDAELAYQMLGDNAKKSYSTIEIFNKNIDNIYEKVNFQIDSYKKRKQKKQYIYNIFDADNNGVYIIEESVMNYKIDF